MSESPSDEFDKERLEQEGEKPENIVPADENDPFAALSSADAPAEDENTLLRLSHLTPDESVLPDGENTIARLAALHPDAELVSPEEGDNTIARLSRLDAGAPEEPDGENTTARLGNFIDSLIDEESEASELDGADELSEGQELDSGVSSRGDLTDGLLDESESAASDQDPFDYGGGLGDGLGDLGDLDDSTMPEAAAEPVDKKKGKKERKAKAKASEKAQKPKKERKTKVARPKREKRPWTSVDTFVAMICVFFVIVIAGGNLWALLLAKGIAVSFFLALFNLFGLVLLMVPYLLWAKKRREGAITFYDALLALTLTLLIFGCMLILSVQARYGTDIKAGGRVLTALCSGGLQEPLSGENSSWTQIG